MSSVTDRKPAIPITEAMVEAGGVALCGPPPLVWKHERNAAAKEVLEHGLKTVAPYDLRNGLGDQGEPAWDDDGGLNWAVFSQSKINERLAELRPRLDCVVPRSIELTEARLLLALLRGFDPCTDSSVQDWLRQPTRAV